ARGAPLARAWAIAGRLAGSVEASAAASEAAVGGGGAPGLALASAAVALAEDLAEPLRLGEPPVVCRVERGRLLLDLAAVAPAEDDLLVDAVLTAAKSGRG